MKKYNAHNSLLPFLMAHQLEVDNHINRYNLCFSYQLHDEHSITVLIEKLQELVKAKSYLRQTFKLDHHKVIGRIHANLPPEIHYVTTSMADLDTVENTLIRERHDISNNSSIRLNIITITDNSSYVALFNIHHILLDANTLDHFVNDLNQLIAGKSIKKDTPEEYINRLEKEVPLHTESDYSELKNYIQSINSIAKNMDNTEYNPSQNVLYFKEQMPGGVMQKLVSASKRYHVSMFNLLLLAWSVFFAKLNNQKNILVNYPTNIRKDKTIPGCFINTLILPLSFAEEETYLSLTYMLRDKMPFFKHLASLQLNNQLKLGAVSNFSNSNLAKPADLILQEGQIPSKGYAQIANSIVCIKYREYQDSLYFSADILSDILPEYVAASLLPRYFNYLNKLLDDPKQLLSQIDLTFPEEKRQVLYEFNQTAQQFPQDKTLVDLFEMQVQKTPEDIALVFEDIKLTYDQLNQKANQLAHYLINCHQIKPDDLIALLLDRNEFTVISILAILKAGGAYVPIDLSYPQERIEYILEDTQANIIILNEHHRDKIKPQLAYPGFESKSRFDHLEIIAIDNYKTQQELEKFDSTNIITADTSTNLAYVIYTSGTTGKPKGVMIEHKNVINTLRALSDVYTRDNEAIPLKITAFTSYAFDVSVSEFFVPLIQGDELHLLSNTLRQDILLTSKYIIENQINYIYLPPVLLANLPRIKYSSLKAIIYAGEPCDKETAMYWSNKTKLYNYYGPTEASIYATGLQIKASEVHLIGKPIVNTTTYVLNTEQLPQPIGVIGELYIGGQGVAKGYLNQRELTEERFISNPFQSEKEQIQDINSRLYKTGDLVRWCPDGNLEYIGRNDFQVKIRGYRIELGEIEAAICSYPNIQQAVVLVKHLMDSEDNQTHNKYLVGYYVANKKIDERKIQEYLALHLPDYMQPSALVHLTHLPLTPNGKLDRKALPEPELTAMNQYSPPTNDKESLVCEAFAKVLTLRQVGIEDDFFKIGGNSIIAISLVANLQSNFNINVTDVFHLKTPKKIARDIPFIKDNLKKNLEAIKEAYHSQAQSSYSYNEARFQNKLDSYYSSIRQLNVDFEKAPISNVLLTGATGFLGCNLLHTLLTSTNYSIFLLIRADTDEHAFERINKQYKFYFDHHLNHFLNKRLFVYAGDLEQKDLGISKETYQMLITQIDSIIHSAALTKHYGEYDTFYRANVQATSHLLELSKLTKLKHFHYISTSSVLNEGYIPNCDHHIFTEDDDGDNMEDRSNIYVKTKYEGEKIVMKYRKHGILGSIYRVGNLAFNASTHRGQENIEENGFFTRINCLINLKMVAPEISMEEISPVDLTAQAIVKLFDISALSNTIFHVFNPQPYNLGDILTQDDSLDVKMVTINQFITTIMKQLENKEYNQSLELFLLHRRWLNEQHRYTTQIKILQDRTQSILKQLGFAWDMITNEDVRKYIKREVEHVKSKHS
ncbi:non-ribosomal peptide synthetase [Legionella quateirensis]|uniref:Peptide synthetase, non-ribosomal n=1 Tax=Legionella quateirensis TaxID=45072 RepID=A0A378KWZ0_9GAMM|nr:non-ribosomal peptide synthetase [Legionella quateirensis]KTD47576.1 peptide synthetase, non-ribosomal [Legionella quateirensis]STY18669.1 peptide synthetase, non-ribosomal [Legionella quateirensis]